MSGTLDTATWIRHVDRIRAEDELLSRGYWHGYTDASGSPAPLRGWLVLVRWELPTIAVSHDDPDEVVRIAQRIEAALGWSDGDVFRPCANCGDRPGKGSTCPACGRHA